MGILVPLMITDRRGVSIMSGVFPNRRVTHLRVRPRYEIVLVVIGLPKIGKERIRGVPMKSEGVSE